jgi:hypothetical protein
MSVSDSIREQLGEDWLTILYRDKVRTQRTRSFQFGIEPREQNVEIFHTLLGIELKVGKKRITCPDFSTARYLSIFARIGCNDIAIPYDITKISTLADELESSWQKTLLLFNELTLGKSASVRGKFKAQLLKEIRRDIKEIGAGALIPEFKQSTTQRKET